MVAADPTFLPTTDSAPASRGEVSNAVREPDWIGDSRLLQEALLYVRTLGQALRAPWTFAAEWADGKRLAMNPLTFFATSLGLSFALWKAVWEWAHIEGAPVSETLQRALPYA